MSGFESKLVDEILGDTNHLESIMLKKGINSEFFVKLNDIKEYIKEISNEKNLTRIIKISNEIDYINSMKDKIPFQRIFNMVSLLLNEIEEIVEEVALINETFKELYINQEKAKGISLLCKGLDDLTGGLYKGKICTIVGGPGSMKTTYATNICYEAVKRGNNVCFLSLEETTMEIYSKLMSRTSLDLNKGLAVQKIVQHKLEENEEKILIEEVHPFFENLKGTFYLLGESDLGDLSHTIIEKKLVEMEDKIKLKSKEKQNGENHGIDIVVVDHLQMFKHVNSKIKDEYQLMNSYVNLFRKNSKNFLNQGKEIVIIILSQCNREGISYATKHDGQYLMSHVAEASEIERASSYIISVYTDAMNQISKQLKIGAIKLRGSALPISTINIFADGEFYKVGDVEEIKNNNYIFEDIETNSATKSESIDSLESILGKFNI